MVGPQCQPSPAYSFHFLQDQRLHIPSPHPLPTWTSPRPSQNLASWTTEKTLLLKILGLRQVGVHNLKFLRPEYLTHLGLVVFESMGLIHHKAGPADGAKCCLINGDQLIRCQENMELHLCLPLSTQHYPFGCHPTSKPLNPHFLPRHPVLTMTAKGSQLSCPATLAPCRDY